MKKFYYLAVFTLIFSFLSCDKNSDDEETPGGNVTLGAMTFGDQTVELGSGIATYYGFWDPGYNTDLSLFSLSQSDIEALIALDNDDTLSQEEYEDAFDAIIGDQILSSFYIEAFSDVARVLSEGTYDQSTTYEAFTFTVAEFSIDDVYYEIFGELTVIQSSQDFYEVEFSGETAGGTAFNLAFEGSFIFEDVAGVYAAAKGDGSKKNLRSFLKK